MTDHEAQGFFFAAFGNRLAFPAAPLLVSRSATIKAAGSAAVRPLQAAAHEQEFLRLREPGSPWTKHGMTFGRGSAAGLQAIALGKHAAMQRTLIGNRTANNGRTFVRSGP